MGYRATLCWDCKKYIDGCSWTKSYDPVEGWTAMERKRHDSENAYINSPMKMKKDYCVIECPEFVRG